MTCTTQIRREPTSMLPKFVNEVDDVPFIFDLNVGETISAATVTASTLSGTDPSPADVVAGPRAISGSEVIQRISAGLPGCSYLITCAITTSSGRVLDAQGALPVI